MRQFRRLLRLSYGRLLDAALASRDIDAEYFVIWGGALLATPLVFFAIRCASVYPYLAERQPHLLVPFALADRMFFIIWPMLVAILLVALIWEGLLPDRTDQQILGQLPIRSQVVAGARVLAAMLSVTAFIGLVSIPGAAIYAIGSAVDGTLGFPPVVFATQVLVSALVGLFTVGSLITVRIVLTLIMGASLAARIAVLVQLLTVLVLVEAFLFLPGLLPALVTPWLRPGIGPDTWLPPEWFLGMYVAVAGPRVDSLSLLAGRALAAAPLACVVGAAISVLTARFNARRAIESPPPKPGVASTAIVAWLSAKLLRAPTSRALFSFILVSLGRSKRHLMILASYVGLALAVASVRMIARVASSEQVALEAPTDSLLALPLVLTFFLIGGLRAAFAVPTDIQANWMFRLLLAPSARGCLPAVRAAILLLAVCPISLLVLATGSVLWGLGSAASVSLMCAASGAALTELALIDCRAIPFARGRALLSSSLKVRLPLALLGLHFFAFRLDDFQLWALQVPGGPALYALSMCAVVLLARAIRRRRLPLVDLAFESPVDGEVLRLNLSNRPA